MRIALDAMGGDDAPEVTLEGARLARRELGVEVVLVGTPEVVGPEGATGDGIEVVHAAHVIGMDEHPAAAVRAKKDASIPVGLRLVREGRAGAFVSAGNSGAVMAAALLTLGRARGIDRPAIGAVIPSLRGQTLLLDAGANADVRPQHVVQFARMGAAYVRALGGGEAAPSVGLLSVGEEETKGSALVLEVHALLKESGLDFRGNVEGRDIARGTVDVVVTDGFTGNVALKTLEGTAELLTHVIREEVTRGLRNRLAALALRGAFRRVAARLSYSETGGAPLLGVRGAVFIAHGRSDANAIKNALRVAHEAATRDIVGAIDDAVAAL